MKSRDPSVAEALAVAGYDFVIADLEHSPLSASDVEGIARACAVHGAAVLCRLAPSSLGLAGVLLDAGVTGIQVSDVSSLDIAEAARDAVRYPPAGSRSVSLSTRSALFGTVPMDARLAADAENTVLVGQIESPAGLAGLDAIVASGIFDALFIGPTDLSVSLGRPGDVWHPSVLSAITKAGEAILGGETALGIFCADAEAALHWARRGACMLAVSSDLTLLSSAAAAVVRQLREDS